MSDYGLLAVEIREAFDRLPKPRVVVMHPSASAQFKAQLALQGVDWREDAACPIGKVYVIDPNEFDRADAINGGKR